MYAVKLKTNLEIEMVEIPANKSFIDFCHEQIGCDITERVHPRNLKDPYVMMIDEEGLLTAKPVINFIGSYLYGTHEHQQPIVGDALIAVQNGPNIGGMSFEKAQAMLIKMSAISTMAYEKVWRAMAHLLHPMEEAQPHPVPGNGFLC